MNTGNTQSGFSLVEMMGALSVIVLMVIALQGTMLSSVHTRESNRAVAQRQVQAHDYVERLLRLGFGSVSDLAASPAQLTELFNDDQELGSGTLKSIETPVGEPGHSFTTLVDGITTRWRVMVNNDLDGDGATTGFREGRQDLLGIEVWANQRLMYRTVRAADFDNTVKN